MAARLDPCPSESSPGWLAMSKAEFFHKPDESRFPMADSYFSITFGTLKKAPSLSGAFSMITSRGKEGPALSSRMA
jgi:hypothetical protein